MRAATILFVLTFAFAARAGESLELGDGVKATLSKGKLEVSSESRTTFAFDLPEASNGTAQELKKYVLAGGAVAVHARVEIGAGKASEAVFITKKDKKTFKNIWKAITGLKGDVGERTGEAVRFEDLTGDGIAEIVTGKVSESVRLCGQNELPLLFRKVFDPGSGAFRPILARRTGLANPIEVKGSLEPGDGPTEALVKQAAPVSASRTAGDRGETLLLAPPGGLVDNDPTTAWIPVPGNGAGEFVTLDLLVQAYGLVRIGIRPLPKVERPEKYDRPATVLLATEKQIFRLGFPADSIEKPDGMIWFDLPRPEQTACISLIVESSFAPASNRPLSMAELVVLTEIDAKDGLDRLARDLNDTKIRRQAAMLLERAGVRAVQPIRKVWPKLDWQGRQRAIGVLADAAPAQGADLLAEAAMSGDPELVGDALRGLRSAGQAAVAPIAAFMTGKSKSDFEKAVDLLASMNNDSALDALAATAGQGDRERRSFLRSRIAMAAGRSTTLAERLLVHIGKAEEIRETEAFFDLLRAGAGNEKLAEGISQTVERVFGSREAFADRWRLLGVMAALKCRSPLERLELASNDSDRLIRAAAVEALGECVDANVRRTNLIEAALKDAEPEVREAALDALGRIDSIETAGAAIREMAGSDPWPQVRAMAVATAGRLPEDLAVPMLEKASTDQSSRVRAAAIKSSASIPGKQVDRIIEATLKNEAELPWIKKIAAETAEKRCQKSALPHLFEVLRKGAEPLADVKDISAAQAAAAAIGAIGGPQAPELLGKAKRRSNPATDRAINAALANLGKKCGSNK